jgi:hypothetical protein
MLVIVMAAAPVLVNVTLCDTLVVPTAWFPNERLVGDSDTVVAVTPVPVSAIDCGELVVVSLMVIAAVIAPAAVGAKCPWMVQLAPAARLVPQLFPNANADAPVPVTAMLLTSRVALPVLVNVTLCDALVDPACTLPNDRLVGDNDTVVGVIPVPVNATDCGEPVALSVMVIAAVTAPAVVGAKCPWMVQFAPAARLEPQLFPNANEAAPVPVTLILLMVRVALPVLVNVTLCDALVAPTSTLPNGKLVADNETVVAVAPVPVKATDCGEPVALSVIVMAAVMAPVAVGAKCP